MQGPLSINLDTANAKTSVPMIADGQYARWRLTAVDVNDGDKGQTLKFKYELTAPAPSTEGTPINPGDFGSTFFENIQLYSKPDSKDPTWFVKRIASRLDALLGTGDAGNAKGKPQRPSFTGELIPTLIGKELVAKMKVRTGEYTGNEFGVTLFPGDVK